jgi:SPP1 family predicted phage head-tail adaptor
MDFMRRAVARYLNESCEIQRAGTAADAYGHSVETWGTVATVNCRILPLQRVMGYHGIIATQEKGRVFYGLVVAYDADLRDGDRVVSGGVTYQVIQVNQSRSDAADQRAVIVRVG